MHKYQASTRRVSRRPEPAWAIAELFPYQGMWDEEDYLALETNRLVEFSNGRIEVLPMPTMLHQLIVIYLHEVLKAYVVARKAGTVLLATFRIRLGPSLFREPDVMFMLKEHVERMGNEFWNGADLVMEVVSGGKEDRRRDLVVKRREYAKARIPEYWIVDPLKETITVLRLSGARYVVHGVFAKGQVATSQLLTGFQVDVRAALEQLAAASKPRKPKRKKPQ